MPDFEITSPDGKRFVVTAPDGASPDQVLAYAQQQFAGKKPADPAETAARAGDSGPLGYLGGVTRAAQNGLTAGFRDEGQAAADASVEWLLGKLTGKPTDWSAGYDRSLGAERAKDRTFAADNPVTSTVANVAGGMALPMPGVGPAIVRPAVMAAEGGALAGFGEGEGGLAQRLQAGGIGAGVGAVGGAALHAGVNAGSKIAGKVLDVAGLRNADTAAERQILRALERDGIDPTAFGRPQASVPAGAEAPLSLADQGGRNVTSLAAVAANVPGRSMEAADAMVQARRGARPERIAGAVDDAFGGGGGTRVADEVANLRETRARDAAPLYERAFGHRVPETVQTRIDPLVASHEGQTALNHAVTILEREGRAAHLRSGDPADLFDPAAMGLVRAEDGGWMLQGRMENMRLVDAVKRGMDDMLEQHRDPATKRLPNTEAIRALNDQRAAYVGYLRGHPNLQPYGRALDAWAGPSRSLDAVEQGRKALGLDRDVVAGIVQRMPAADMEFFRLGVGRAITDATSDPARAVGVARKMLEDRQMQARLQSAIPDPAQRAQFTAALENEVRMAATERAVSPRAGSQTARLQASMDDMGVDPPGGIAMSLLDAGRTGGFSGAGARGLQMLYRRSQGINSSTADALAQRLLSMDAGQNAQTAARLTARQAQDLAKLEGNRGLAQRLLQGMGVAGGLTAN